MADPRPAKVEFRVVRPDTSGVTVGLSKVHGRGLYAARDFRRGERIIEYGGIRVPKSEGTRRADAQWARGRVYVFEISNRFDLDGAPAWNIARLANQSCDPNCESDVVRGRIWVLARRRIRKGEEITYDYNLPLTDPPLVCHCGAAKCRGYVVGEDHVAELQAWLAARGPQTRQTPSRRTRRST